jgi:hypothetical protein
VIQRIAMGHGMAGRKLQSMFRGPRTTRFAASVGSINFDNSHRPLTGFLARGLVCLSAGLALGACSATTSTPPVHSEEKIMPIPAPTAAAPHDAPEVLRRLLALIDTLHQPQDLTIERVAQFSGFAMTPFSDKPTNDAYEIFQPLTEMWSYQYIWKLNSATRLPDLGIGFDKTEKYVDRPPMTEICQLDAAQFHDTLLKMGYRHVGNTRRESPARQYQRGSVEVEIAVVGESGASLEKISHDCIKRVSIGFLVKYMDLGAM